MQKHGQVELQQRILRRDLIFPPSITGRDCVPNRNMVVETRVFTISGMATVQGADCVIKMVQSLQKKRKRSSTMALFAYFKCFHKHGTLKIAIECMIPEYIYNQNILFAKSRLKKKNLCTV